MFAQAHVIPKPTWTGLYGTFQRFPGLLPACPVSGPFLGNHYPTFYHCAPALSFWKVAWYSRYLSTAAFLPRVLGPRGSFRRDAVLSARRVQLCGRTPPFSCYTADGWLGCVRFGATVNHVFTTVAYLLGWAGVRASPADPRSGIPGADLVAALWQTRTEGFQSG